MILAEDLDELVTESGIHQESKQIPKSRSHSLQYINNCSQRIGGTSSIERVNVFALNRENSLKGDTIIPRVVRARHDEISLESLSLERLNSVDIKYDSSPVGQQIKKDSREFILHLQDASSIGALTLTNSTDQDTSPLQN